MPTVQTAPHQSGRRTASGRTSPRQAPATRTHRTSQAPQTQGQANRTVGHHVGYAGLDRPLSPACDSWISASRRGGAPGDAGLGSARGVLLRPCGLEPSGYGLEQSDQLLELQLLQSVVRSFCEGVGQ